MASQKSREQMITECTRIGQLFQASLCEKSVIDCKNSLNKLIEGSTSVKAKAAWNSKMCLLDELVCVKSMPVHMAYDEYLGHLPDEFQPKYRNDFQSVYAFVRSLMHSRGGLPVLIINCPNGERYIMLYEYVGQENNVNTLRTVDHILSRNKGNPSDSAPTDQLSQHFKSLMGLLLSDRERAVMICMLSLIYSSRTLRNKYEIHEDFSANIKKSVIECTETEENQEVLAQENAVAQWDNTMKVIERKLANQELSLARNSERLSTQEIISRETDISDTRKRLIKVQGNRRAYVRRVAARSMKTWKKKLFSQTGKGSGTHRIDRGAELAVFKALQDQLVAHKSRTGVPQLEGRMHLKDLKRIANEWLNAHGKKYIIKSDETIRSWAKPRCSRSIQSKQHRGQGLFKCKRALKNFAEAHINIHHNRAHIKQYTRLIFSKERRTAYKKYTIRRCFDDKAYLRCGTSEGFSRPRTKPIMLHGASHELPAYDFPEKAGYVAPGVNLMIKDMAEVEKDRRDVYALTSATISVTCKPKYSYGSSATKWPNDNYADRLRYPEEHEVEGTGADIEQRDIKTALVFLRDSFVQFQLMNVDVDYGKATQDDECLQREKHRLVILCQRILHLQSVLVSSKDERVKRVVSHMNVLLIKVQGLECQLTKKVLSKADSDDRFVSIGRSIELFLIDLQPIIPQHRPIDIQTTDAGPGVGTSEELVRIRMTEQFLINDLDMQSRFHYAPRDSKAHKVEQVMSALNDACGDGRFIPIPQSSLVDTVGEARLLAMSTTEVAAMKEMKQRSVAIHCAEQVAARYEGARCMGTTIHATTPDSHQYMHFFFDEEYMKRVHEAKSLKKREACPGYGYYNFLASKQNKIYIQYQNGIEGLRQHGQFRCPYDVERVPPPVPNYQDSNATGTWHYYKDTPEEEKGNVYNPMTKLTEFVNSCGEPDIQSKDEPGEVVVFDANATWQKLTAGKEDFIAKYCGSDLRKVVEKEIENKYLQKLRKASKQLKSEQPVDISETQLTVIQTGELKIKITKPAAPSVLPWNGTYISDIYGPVAMTNTCTIDNSLYILHVAMTYKPDLAVSFKNSNDRILKLLYDIHVLFGKSEFAHGKYLWFIQVLGLENNIDAHGTEDYHFFEKLRHLTRTTFTSACSNKDCPQPANIQSGSIVTYSEPEECPAKTFQGAIMHWVNNKRQKPCNKSIENKVCAGVRKFGQRHFIDGLPLILPIDVANCPWNVPSSIKIHQSKYTLCGMTLSKGHHFVSTVKMGSQWIFYDGLREYNKRGSGTRRVKTWNAPPRYQQSVALFLKENV